MKAYTKPEILLLDLSCEDILTMSSALRGDKTNVDSFSFVDINFDI